MLLADLSLGDLIISLVWLFFLFLFVFVVIIILMDLFRSHDLSGWAKAIWVVGIILLPLIGALVYLIVRGGGMSERAVVGARRDQELTSDLASAVPQPTPSLAEELQKLADLHDRGKLSDEEYAALKSRILDDGT